MKIMFIGNDTTYVYNLRDQVIGRLIRDGHEIVIVCEMRSFQQELIQMGCRLISITIGRHGKNPFHDITLYSEIKRIVKKEERCPYYHYQSLEANPDAFDKYRRIEKWQKSIYKRRVDKCNASFSRNGA